LSMPAFRGDWIWSTIRKITARSNGLEPILC
jgi:hypothetical protein